MLAQINHLKVHKNSTVEVGARMILDQDKLVPMEASHALKSLLITRTPEHQVEPSSSPLAARTPTQVLAVWPQPLTHSPLSRAFSSPHLHPTAQNPWDRTPQSFIFAPPIQMYCGHLGIGRADRGHNVTVERGLLGGEDPSESVF